MTCKEHCIHYPVCKDTVADENWTDEAPTELRLMYSPCSCETFSPATQIGYWEPYSTTMMECSICKKHVPKHKYKYCPECGSKMLPKVKIKLENEETWEQLTILDYIKE